MDAQAPRGRRRHRPALRRLRRRAASSTSTRFNTTNAHWPLSLLQPPTVFDDTLFLGWAGKDWAEAVDSPGSVFALDARTGAVKWTFDTLPPELARQDRHRQRLGLDVGRSRAAAPLHPGLLAQPQLLPGAVPARPARRHLGHRARHRYRRAWSGPASSSTTTSGTSTPTPRRRSSTSRRTAAPSPPWCRPRSRASSTSSTAPPASRSIPIEERPVPQTDVPGEISVADPALRRPAPSASSPTAGPASSGSPTSSPAAGAPAPPPACATRAPSPRRASKGSLVYPGTIGGIEWGGGAVDPRSAASSSSTTRASVQIYRLIPRADYDAAAAGRRRDRRLLPA